MVTLTIRKNICFEGKLTFIFSNVYFNNVQSCEAGQSRWKHLLHGYIHNQSFTILIFLENFNFFVQDGDNKKITRSAVTEPKISYFFKCHVKFQKTKFQLRNHRGRCFMIIPANVVRTLCFYLPKRAKNNEAIHCS